mgnify:CR=1 FL=1
MLVDEAYFEYADMAGFGTAIGLVAAIPAVMIYNVFARSITGYKQALGDAVAGIERDNPALKGVLPKDYARPALDKQRLGQLIDGAESAVARTPVDYRLGRHRTHAGQGVELLRRRRVEVDLPARRPCIGRAARRRTTLRRTARGRRTRRGLIHSNDRTAQPGTTGRRGQPDDDLITVAKWSREVE